METLFLVLLSILCYVIAGTIHELGHVLTGLYMGFKFELFVVGPFGLKRNSEDRIVFYFEKKISLWGGISATSPVDVSQDNYKKFSRILLGGPMFSIVSGIIIFPLGILSDGKVLSILGAMLISMGVMCLMPLRNGAFYTDGGRWLRMNRNESTKAVEVSIWNLVQNSTINQSCADLNMGDITLLVNDPDVRTKYVGHYYAYYYYKDNMQTKGQAIEKNELEKLKNQVTKQMVSIYRLD